MKSLNIFVLFSIFIVKTALAAVNPLYLNDINDLFEDNNVKAKRDDHSSDNKIACKNELKSFSDCYTIDNRKIDEQVCTTIMQDRCNKFFKDPASYIPSCAKYDKSMGEGYNALYKLIGSLYQYSCVNNRNCTIAKQLVNKIEINDIQSNLFTSPTEEDLDSDCHYKDCADSATDMYGNLLEYVNVYSETEKKYGLVNATIEEEYNKEIKSINNILEYLKSPACVQQSGAVRINASNVLLFSIITFILVFLF